MSTNLQIQSAVELALIQGDLSRLSSSERVNYYNALCNSLGLNPLTQPFAYLKLSGKEVLYAKKDATDQLRKIHGVSIYKLETQVVEGITVVTAFARDKHGKEDSEIGAVSIKGLQGENLANAMMKASTKAKRRVTLSICGLGMLDESETDSIPGATTIPASGEVVRPAVQPAAPIAQDDIPLFPASGAGEPDPADYVLPFGKWKGKRLGDIDMYELDGYCRYLVGNARARGQEISGQVAEALAKAEAYLVDCEYDPSKKEGA